VLARELQLRAKLAKTSWISVGVAGFALFGWLMPILLGRAPISSGRFSVLTLSFCPMLMSIFCGVGTTADCVSREKREGTLALLLLTRVSPFELLLQKMLSTSAPFLSGLVSVLPLCALPVILGGVTGPEVLVVMLLVSPPLLSPLPWGASCHLAHGQPA
jgi:hypothetical protein